MRFADLDHDGDYHYVETNFKVGVQPRILYGTWSDVQVRRDCPGRAHVIRPDGPIPAVGSPNLRGTRTRARASIRLVLNACYRSATMSSRSRTARTVSLWP